MISNKVRIAVFSCTSEKMALALAESIELSCRGPIIDFVVQEYCAHSRQLAALGAARIAPTVSQGHPHLRWLNKLDAISRSTSDQTLFLDTDMLVMRDIGHWFEGLATDDLTFWNFRRRPDDVPEGSMIPNQLNPHPFCRHYGVEAVPIMLGGGHYFFRNTERGHAILQRIADIMLEASENPDALYWKFAGKENFVGDEPAASMAVVEMGVKLPEPSSMAPNPPVGCFMAPWQRWTDVNLAEGRARYWCEWAQCEVEPEVVHFAGGGKNDEVYQAHVKACWAAAHDRTIQ